MLLSVFSTVLNMSITAGIAILFVLVARLLLKKAPKVFSYALWAVVLFRLLCPVSLSSVFSLMNMFDVKITENGQMEYISMPTQDMRLPSVSAEKPKQNSETAAAEKLEITPEVSDKSRIMTVLSVIWIGGAAVMLVCNITQLIKLRRNLIGAVLIKDNIYLVDHIESPFVMGLLLPKIYLPSDLSDREREYIIQHEQHHIKRCDHAVRILSFAALCIHWFNPLVWLAFSLSGKDMEMSCDEAVMKKTGRDIRAEYSASLLQFSTGRKAVTGVPLAFGEGDTRERIENIMKYKKPMLWAIAAAVILCTLLTACLSSNPNGETESENKEAQLSDLAFESIDLESNPGVGFELVFESDNRIIFYGKSGIYCYDLAENEMIFTVDFVKAYGKEGSVQGEYGTLVEASNDGQSVVLSYTDPDDPEKVNDSYFIDVSSMTYTKGDYKPLENAFLREQAEGQVIPFSTIKDTVYIKGDKSWTPFVYADLQTRIHSYLSNLFDRAYSPYYEGLRYEMSDYKEEIDGENFTATFFWTMYHLDSGGDVYSDLGMETQANFSFQATGKISGGSISSVEVLGDVNVGMDGPDYSAPVEGYFPDENSSLILTGYIKNIDTYARTVLFDKVFWLTEDKHSKLLEALGVESSEMPNGYYIYNPEEKGYSYPISENAVFRIFDETGGARQSAAPKNVRFAAERLGRGNSVYEITPMVEDASENGEWAMIETDLETFAKELNTRTPIYTVTVQNGEITSMAERDVP